MHSTLGGLWIIFYLQFIGHMTPAITGFQSNITNHALYRNRSLSNKRNIMKALSFIVIL